MDACGAASYSDNCSGVFSCNFDKSLSSTGQGDTTVTVTGGGFLPCSTVTITFNGVTVATTTATAYGEIPLGTTVFVSSTMPGSYPITATDTSSDSASANYILPPIETIVFQLSGVGSDVSGAPILTIDSVNYTYSSLPAQFNWPAESTHTITALTVAAGTGNNTRGYHGVTEEPKHTRTPFQLQPP